MAVDPPLRALVVDDDPTYRVLLQAVLENGGWRPTSPKKPTPG